ncbi:MAG: 3,4-dihydroxyphenylacetate 2,3-dioxygenase [bacterium ADurb.Bin400]|nr:MAG: 3,4-dihydroxyphenylacetate 2,3-dioxygenase [bacterium ADurb.Bin400]
MIVYSAFVPHPPLIVPGVGKGREKQLKKTEMALARVAKDIASSEPDTILVITPHARSLFDRFNVCGMEKLTGSLAEFELGQPLWEGRGNPGLARLICERSEKEGIAATCYDDGESGYELDYGSLVPLYFISQQLEFSCKVLPIGYSLLSRAEHFVFGQAIGEACAESRERIAIIASGDLSHRLGYKIPEGFGFDGERFDHEFIRNLKENDVAAVLEMDEELVESAGECGYRSALVLLGIISDLSNGFDEYSYEGPYGIGHLVGRFKI